ncbi:phospholipase C [Deinococcus aluminii]|uniref:Phospholipase C 3 n=1 Tax=Deinococcus aluminii TaxID=1656885 RepID=A0ABP9XGD2_9DEIO
MNPDTRRLTRVLWCSLAVAASVGLTAQRGQVNGPATTAASAVPPSALHANQPGPTAADGIHKIRHVVVIMQENRSFDHYFGTYPGAAGFPTRDGQISVCVPDPARHTCQAPYHDPHDLNFGASHGAASAVTDIDGGKMDGFIRQAEADRARTCRDPNDPQCGKRTQKASYRLDVMGYHDRRELPNYWAYADNFVLQDHMFEPNASWSLPAHLFQVSEWSARCSQPADPQSCVNELQSPGSPPDFGQRRRGQRQGRPAPDYAWTDLTYLLHRAGVSWGYYVFPGSEPDCEDDGATCARVKQSPKTPGIWNPLPYFDTVKQDGQLGNIQDLGHFYAAARQGSLPAVSWIAPSNAVSEHPTALVSTGQAYVTSLVNAVMAGPDWDSTAIFLAWDDWGGFYDHVVPPRVDQNGYGLRVPGLVISAYAKKGFIDHQTLSFDAYVKFIEDDFLGGQRLDPHTDGRPDPRPTVRENVAILGDLRADFDFTQPPRRPLPLPTSFVYGQNPRLPTLH